MKSSDRSAAQRVVNDSKQERGQMKEQHHDGAIDQ